SAPAGASVQAGDRVAGFCGLGGFAETAVAPEFFTFALAPLLDFAQGAGLILNYHTAYFALAMRGRLKQGETVLVHGAAGGVGTGACVMSKPELDREVGAAVGRMVDEGVVRPIVGERFPLERASEALRAIDERRARGKVVLDMRAGWGRAFRRA